MTALRDTTIPRWIAIHVWAVVIVVLLPILAVVPVSFNVTASMSLPTEGLSIRWYQALFADSTLLRACGLSVVIAVLSALIGLVVAIPAAYVIVRHKLALIDIVLLSPITFPGVVFGGALLMIFAPLGLVRTVPGLVAAHVAVTLPYVVRTMVSTIHGIDAGLEDAATMLGADRLSVLRYVILPLAAPGIVSAFCFAFIISFDEFSVSLFLVGTNVMTLPLALYQHMQFIIDPTVAAASVLLVGATFAFVYLLDRTVGIERFFRGR